MDISKLMQVSKSEQKKSDTQKRFYILWELEDALLMRELKNYFESKGVNFKKFIIEILKNLRTELEAKAASETSETSEEEED